jgi:hypothetical protein
MKTPSKICLASFNHQTFLRLNPINVGEYNRFNPELDWGTWWKKFYAAQVKKNHVLE